MKCFHFSSNCSWVI